MKQHIIIINFIAFIVIALLVIYTINIELKDMAQLNSSYKKLSKNKECVLHLQAVNAFPIWRMSFYIGLITAIISTFYLYLLVHSKVDKSYFITLFFWTFAILQTLVIYKTIAFWNWHYVSNDGGLPNQYYTNQ